MLAHEKSVEKEEKIAYRTAKTSSSKENTIIFTTVDFFFLLCMASNVFFLSYEYFMLFTLQCEVNKEIVSKGFFFNVKEKKNLRKVAYEY